MLLYDREKTLCATYNICNTIFACEKDGGIEDGSVGSWKYGTKS